MSHRPTRGMVLGKFMPPHRGHEYLVRFAEAYVDALTVVVGTLASEPIPGVLRFEWMRELAPRANVLHLAEKLPQHPEDDPDFWRIWRESLQRILPGRPDFVFASEAYGVRLAEELGAAFVPVDPLRRIFPVSGTAVREDPLGNWAFLPECVRPHFARRVCVFGPESTGKTTLTERLARHFDTVAVPEYARTLLELKGGACMEEDLERIARGQVASEDALARRANRVLFCDTDPLTTCIWSRALFGRSAEPLELLAAQRAYDLYLLLDVDVPWVQDPVRYLPEERQSFFDACVGELEQRGRPYVVIRGSWEDRFRQACGAVERLLRR